VPERLINPKAKGRIVIAIAEDTPNGLSDLGDHLHAFLTR
jgi:hypothetical protein